MEETQKLRSGLAIEASQLVHDERVYLSEEVPTNAVSVTASTSDPSKTTVAQRQLDSQNFVDTTYRGALELASEYKPTKTCLEEILVLSQEVPRLDYIILDCKKYLDSSNEDKTLNKDERMALALYSYDLGMKCERSQNFYHVLNSVLQKRNNELMAAWRGYLFYFFSALRKINNQEITVYRGINCDIEFIKKNYTKAKKIHWSAFSSTTTDVTIARSFCHKSKMIFKLEILNGKDIRKYSVIKGEKEILLHPNMSFIVTKTARLESDGYWYVDLLQTADADTFIF